MSDTPKTDAAMSKAMKQWKDVGYEQDKSLVEVTGEVLFEHAKCLERELNKANEAIRVLKRTLRLTQDDNEELQRRVDGYTKCEACNGDCGRHEGSVGRLGSPVDPQTWVDCDACEGEGWVK